MPGPEPEASPLAEPPSPPRASTTWCLPPSAITSLKPGDLALRHLVDGKGAATHRAAPFVFRALLETLDRGTVNWLTPGPRYGRITSYVIPFSIYFSRA